MAVVAKLLARMRAARWCNLCVVNLRFLIGFAFVPAALKKVLGQPFTDPTNHGPFHDFLHGFYATGGAAGVGEAVNHTVVRSVLAFITLNYFLTSALFGGVAP